MTSESKPYKTNNYAEILNVVIKSLLKKSTLEESKNPNIIDELFKQCIFFVDIDSTAIQQFRYKTYLNNPSESFVPTTYSNNPSDESLFGPPIKMPGSSYYQNEYYRLCDKNSLLFFNNPKINKIFVTFRRSPHAAIKELEICGIKNPIVWCAGLENKSVYIINKMKKELLGKQIIVIDDRKEVHDTFTENFFQSIFNRSIEYASKDIAVNRENLEIFKLIKDNLMLFLFDVYMCKSENHNRD
jgi:hypothetical protein